MKKYLLAIITLMIVTIGMGIVSAYPDNVQNDASSPDSSGFTYMPLLQWYTDEQGYIDYSDPTMIYKITLQNTKYVSNLLVDSQNSNLLYNLYNLANEGATQQTIGSESHYVLTIDTSQTTTTQPVGVTQSQSGTYHYGVINIDEDGDGQADLTIKVWVVDTATAGTYDTVFIDVNSDLTIDYSNLKAGSYFDLDNMRIVIYSIASNGNSVEIYNKWDNLVAGQPSPLGTGVLQQVLQAHWVVTPNIPYTVNADTIELKVLEDNNYVDPTSDDFAQLSVDTTSKTFSVTALLGGYGLINYNIPTTRDLYVFFHLTPVTYTTERDFDSTTSTTVITLDVTNNAGVELPQGYIRIQSIAPLTAYEQIANSLQVISGNIQVEAEQTINGVDLIVKFTNLPTGNTQVQFSYIYKDELTDTVKNIQTEVENLNQQVNDLNNKVDQNSQNIQQIQQDISTLLQQVQDIATNINDLQQNGVQVDLTSIQNQLTDIQNTLQALDTIQQGITDLQNKMDNIKLGDVQTMKQVYESEYSDASSILQQIMQGLNSIALAYAGADNGSNDLGGDLGGGLGGDLGGNLGGDLGGNSGGDLGGGLGGDLGGNNLGATNTITIDFTAQYTELQNIVSMISNEFNNIPKSSDLPDDPFVIMMYYQKLLMLKQELYQVKMQLTTLEVATSLGNDGISQLASIIDTKSQAFDDIQTQLTTISAQTKQIMTISAQVQQIQQWVTKQEQAAQASQSNNKSGLNPIMLIGIVLIIVLLGAYLVMSRKKGGKNTGAEAGAMPPTNPAMPMGGMPGAEFGAMQGAQQMGGVNTGMPGVPPQGNMGMPNQPMGNQPMGNNMNMGGQNFGGF